MKDTMPPTLYRAAFAAATVAVLATAAASDTTSVTITTSKDNTLIQSNTGASSNGAGDGFFAGRVGPMGGSTIRRGVIAFDIAGAVPEGATIEEVSLTLFMAVSIADAHTVHLKRLLADWGEGTSAFSGGIGAPSTPGDATWIHRFFPDVFWNTDGGDFTNTISASALVGSIGFYTWHNTPQLVADVQGWLDNPETNFGWLVQGNEAISQTVKKFTSREGPEDQRPALTITYTEPKACVPADLDCSGSVGVPDLLILLSAWGDCDDCDDCPADLTGSCSVGVPDLLVLLGNWG